MNDFSLPAYSIFLLLFLCFFIAFTDCIDDPAAYITGDVSINCGSAAVSAAHNGRKWVGDKHPKFSSSMQLKGTSTISSVIRTDSVSDYQVPYNTARISSSAFSYTFLLNPGQKFIRLHFNPTAYKGFKRWKDLFDVVAGPFTLLGNFSASLTGDALGLSYFTKEYCLNVEENQLLNIIFSPATSQSLDAYAFINGIEIIPVTSDHSCFHDEGTGARVIGHESQLFYVDNGTALEMVHRGNRGKVGWVSASSGDDFGEIFGTRETVPKEKASDMTWKIHVDMGFRYLVRLRFSNRGLKMIENGRRIFKVVINEVVACTNADIFEERDDIVFLKHDYRDFIVIMRGRKEEGKSDLSLEACGEFIDGHGPFTGFEIFKLSNFDNSLAFPNPLPSTRDSPSWTILSLLSIIAHRNIIATAAVVIVSLVNVIVHKLRGILESNKTEEENKPSARAELFCRRFSLSEIRSGTRNFSDAYLIGKGGFGKVYKCIIDNGNEIVAIKRLKSNSRQGEHEFWTEIETLSELRHVNLVSLIGYCNEHREMILVYDYMPNGTLADHLYKLERNGSSFSSLAWKQRLDICIGAGRGLDYLHTGHSVIHRDVKVSNILLDENFTAKVSDFGLVKHENRHNPQSHVSTKVKGTFGYFDPDYFSTGKLTRKSDVYSFGVVLLEVLCGRPALDQSVPMDEQILTKWATEKICKGEVDPIIASSLRGEILPDSLKTFVQVVERCLDDEPKKRPTMAHVVLQLEFALEQQETVRCSVPNEIVTFVPCNDETGLDSGQLTMSSTYGQTFPPPPKEQSNSNMDNAYPSSGGNLRKVPAYKPPWRPWNATWNIFKSRQKNELSIPGTAGLRKAVDVLDTLGSNMTNLKLNGGSAARMGTKRNRIFILAFEVANTIARGANLMHSLSKKNIDHLKEVVLQSEGVNRLIAKDTDELLRITAYDKRDELKVFSEEVVRFGNLCWNPQWHNLDRYFEMLATELPPLKKAAAETEIQQLMTVVQYTAELYHELNELSRLEDFKALSNSGQREEIPSALRLQLKSQRKYVQSLKKKSLWFKILEEVMEKLVKTVHFLHLEIHSAFGSYDGDEPVKNSHQKLGSAGLALHYANIVTQIDTIAARSTSVPPSTRDALYQGLPPGIKSALRTRLQSFHLEEELAVPQIKEEMEKTLQWLAPMATNTTKAHQCFGWVGEWANTWSEQNRKPPGQTYLLRIETLHYADKKKTDAYILNLVVWLHRLINRSRAANGVRSKTKSAILSPNQSIIQLNSPLTFEDQEMLRDVSKRKLTPGISKSQEFDTSKMRLFKQHRLTKSRSHSPACENKDPFFPIIDFEIDRIRALDVIDRVNKIQGTEWSD